MIKGTTLKVTIDGGNIGHAFNDHSYAEFAYYLKNINDIQNIYFELTCTNDENEKNIFLNYLNEKKIFDDKSKKSINMGYSLLFFMFENKNFYVNNNEYKFESLIELNADRFFEHNNNYIEVFLKLRNNFKNLLSISDMPYEHYDIGIIYRNNSNDRSMINLECLITKLEKCCITYKILKTNNYSFMEIGQLFFSSDNVISIHGCELTFGFLMHNNANIIELYE